MLQKLFRDELSGAACGTDDLRIVYMVYKEKPMNQRKPVSNTRCASDRTADMPVNQSGNKAANMTLEGSLTEWQTGREGDV